MAISRIQWQSSSRIRRSNGRSLEIHHESRTFSFCPRAAGLPKERFQTPPKNKLALPVGSRALSHRFCTHRTPEREERGSSKFLLPTSFIPLPFPLSFHFVPCYFPCVAHFHIRTKQRFEIQHHRPTVQTHFTRLFLQKSRVPSRD